MAKILVADDEEDVGMIVSERLRHAGHEVEWAPDGKIAVQMFEEGFFDLAVLDIRMPGLNGYEVCEWIKRSSKKVPVLLISAFSEERTAWRNSKADRFLPKPFDGMQLVSAVQELLKPNPSK